MQVTQITDASKNRSNIFIDFEFAFVLYKGELRLYHIQEGEELAEADYRTIFYEVLPKRARLRCMNLLKSRDYTEAQLREKLKQGGYPDSVAKQAISYVKEYGYIQDEKYAGSYIACFAGSRSRMKIECGLLQRGIKKEVIEQAWEAWQAEGNKQDEEEMIRSLLQKRKWNFKEEDWKERQKTAAFLVRKGFRLEVVSRVMKIEGNK